VCGYTCVCGCVWVHVCVCVCVCVCVRVHARVRVKSQTWCILASIPREIMHIHVHCKCRRQWDQYAAGVFERGENHEASNR